MNIEPSVDINGNLSYDAVVRKHFKEGTPQAVIGWIIMASYCYYIKYSETSLLSDECYDNIMKYIHINYDDIKHRYKYLISKEDAKAGSLYKLRYEDYPEQLVIQAEKFLEKLYQYESKSNYVK